MSDSKPNDAEVKTSPSKVEQISSKHEIPKSSKRKRIIVVGLGMVGIAFIEKLMKLDVKRREYDVIVIGEEPHLAYNRVGLTSYFQHRKVEDLYLNPKEWYSSMPEESLKYHLNTRVITIDSSQKVVICSDGSTVPYDSLVLSTGSDAVLPQHTPGHDAKGVFVYRTIQDLQDLISFAATKQGTVGAIVGGGLLGLEAAKAMMDLEDFEKVKLIERNKWVLSRQLDEEAGSMVVEQVTQLGVDVLLSKRVGKINTDSDNNVIGVTFEDGEEIECSCICFAIGIRPRDDLARQSGIKCVDRGGGGIIIDNYLQTSIPNIYAIGECASWENSTFGLIAPGIEMADVLAFNFTQAKAHSPRKFKRPDLSTKLKLLGVEVASFGDFFADRDGPKELPVRHQRGAKKENGITPDGNDGRVKTKTKGSAPPPVKALTYKDPFQQVYKKYLFTMDGKYLLGGMMIGDTKDYIKLVPMVKNQTQLEIPPGEFIIGTSNSDDDGSDLADDTQICSCHNVLKGDIRKSIKDGSCKSVGDIKSCTKAGTGCGGCMPLVQTIFNKEMAAMGQEVKNNLCPHFPDYSRADLFNIVYVKRDRLTNFREIMRECGADPESSGCEACKPAVASILASLFNKHIMDKDQRGLQDSNDRFLANIQRNGTFSVIPRVAGGEITPEKLIVIGTVAKKYGLYTKITGGQRIDMFGAKKQDLLDIWTELIEGGLESGHAYAKSLRTVKSCVGTTWCRFGIGDSVGMAVRLEERYKSIRSPHKLKGGVSGCVRECAEAQSKDFGLIATEKGFNIFVGGNGGAKPRHTDLLAKDVPPDDVVPILDRYLSFYIRTADKLQRTARWIENLPGGIQYLREVILEDKLGICADLEQQMLDLISSYYCEWTETIRNPTRRAAFQQFANTTAETSESIEMIKERGQTRPAQWPKESVTTDFANHKWQTELTWQPLIESDKFEDVATGFSLPVKRGDTQLAVFKIKGEFYATQQMCPHKRAFALSEGLIGESTSPLPKVDVDFGSDEENKPNGNVNINKNINGTNGTHHKPSKPTHPQNQNKTKNQYWISCPFHKRNFNINTSSSSSSKNKAGTCTNDPTLSIATFAAEKRNDFVYVKLPSVEELDSVLGTEKWKVRGEETEGGNVFEGVDGRLKGLRGRRVGGANGVTNGVGKGDTEGRKDGLMNRVMNGDVSVHEDGDVNVSEDINMNTNKDTKENGANGIDW